jgi:predicted  nucleic acid-binding Zn-ribbon protein
VATIRAQLRAQHLEVAQLEATLQSDERALAAMRGGSTGDRVALDVLEAAREGAAKAYRAASRRLATSKETIAPLLQHLVETLEKLDQDASEAREGLSRGALKCYEGLLRLKKLPFVAHVEAGACGECHLKLPSAFAGTVSDGTTLFRCALCGRVLLPPPSVSS